MIVLPESELYAMLFGNEDLAHRRASRGKRGFQPASYNSRRELKSGGKFFIPIGCNPLKRLDLEK
jgi:hypothetical protein